MPPTGGRDQLGFFRYLAEHMRQHARVTVEDQALEARAFAFLQQGVAPVAAHLIAARTYDDQAAVVG